MKRKININRPEISSEEIAKGKNFDSVLKKHGSANTPVFKNPWFLSSVIVTTVAVITTIVMLKNEPKNKNEESNQQVTAINDSIALAKFYKSEEAKPCINPPLDGVNIPYTIYKVIAEKGATLDFKTGSKIVIPKNAFVDENGIPLKDEVELRYREFHDAADFFVSGIPMSYDSAGLRYQFESAGMMEMLAFQNGKPVNMAKDKSVHVELASNYSGTEYNLYKLDTLKNNWSCLGKDRVVSATTPSEKTEKGEKNARVDFKQTPQNLTIETQRTDIQKEKEVQITSLPKVIAAPRKPVQAKKDKFTFNLDVDAKEFPELAVYKNVLFEVGTENKNFNKSMYDITWDEATINDGVKKGENYLLTLKKASKKYELVVYPVFEEKNYEVALKDFQDKFIKYNAVLEKRKMDEKRIEEEYQTKLLALKKQQEELEQKWKKELEDQFLQMDTGEKVRRMFTINSFGIYNSDNPSNFPKGVSCSANLTTDKNIKLKCYEVYLVDRAKNGLFCYNYNPIVKFSFNPQSTNILWTIENGVLYWLKPAQFNDIKSADGMSDLKMNRVDQKFKSVDELKTFFNL